MKKIKITTVAEALRANQCDPAIARKVIEDLQAAAGPDEEKPPGVKKQYSVIVSDPEQKLVGLSLVAWVVQIPESEGCVTSIDRVIRTARDFNASKKGRLMPVHSVGEALENIAPRYFDEEDLWVKTKTPVLVIRTNNELPTETK